MKRYQTGLIASPSECRELSSPIVGRGWQATFEVTKKSRDTWEAPFGGRPARAREVILHARNWQRAQATLSLIRACLLLESSAGILFHDTLFIAHNDSEPDEMNRMLAGQLSAPGIALACALAARASTSRRWVYAVLRFALSTELYSQAGIDLDPKTGRHFPLSRFPEDHIRFACALVMAYSIIEDLQLELRASSTNPSRLRDGSWNPSVRDDLVGRLRAAGVAPSESFYWIARGPKGRIEKRHKLPDGDKPEWTRGLGVRDVRIELIEAIARASTLRSKVAAHGARLETASLSPYDVINVQHVGRRLLQCVLGGRRPQQQSHGPAGQQKKDEK